MLESEVPKSDKEETYQQTSSYNTVCPTPENPNGKLSCKNNRYNVFRSKTSEGDYITSLSNSSYKRLTNSLDENANIDGLKGLNCLECLCIGGNRKKRINISDLTLLSQIKSLKRLCMLFTNVFDLSPLSKLNKLQEIYIDCVPVSNINFISNLKRLKVLKVENTNISDIGSLETLENLEVLILQGNKNLENLEPIKNLSNLKFIDIRGTSVSEGEYKDIKDHLPSTIIKFNEKKLKTRK